MEEITTDVHAYSYAIMSCLERFAWFAVDRNDITYIVDFVRMSWGGETSPSSLASTPSNLTN
jgi:hypothetical protein